jgi:phage baseplate assembly protein W
VSFDLSLRKGDLYIGSDGDLQKVRGTSKLAQDVLKVIHTPTGSNPYFPRIGSDITELNIGETLNADFAESRVELSVKKSIEQIQLIQNRQQLEQAVTQEEKIEKIAEVIAERDNQDPRQFNIKVSVITGALSAIVLPSFSLSTIIGGER